MRQTAWAGTALAVCSVLPLSACSRQVTASPEIAAAVDAYADALADAFVKPAVEGGRLGAIVATYKERELVAKANALVGPYKLKWENASATVTDLQCSGGADAIDCSYVAHVGLSAPNETAEIVFPHSTHLVLRDDGSWRVDQDEVTS